MWIRSPSLAACERGKVRWSVTTGTNQDAGQVNLTKVHRSSSLGRAEGGLPDAAGLSEWCEAELDALGSVDYGRGPGRGGWVSDQAQATHEDTWLPLRWRIYSMPSVRV